MSLFIVRRKNNHFPSGTQVELTEDGFQKVVLKQGPFPGTWVIDNRVGLIIPWSAELADCLLEVGAIGTSSNLPADILAKIREDFNK